LAQQTDQAPAEQSVAEFGTREGVERRGKVDHFDERGTDVHRPKIRVGTATGRGCTEAE
jgi:hypothetical protein